MKSLLFSILTLTLTKISFGQNAKSIDTIPRPIYDTISYQLRSTNSFYFCSNLYKIQNDCNSSIGEMCCYYQKDVYSKSDLYKFWGMEQINCNRGNYFYWNRINDEALAKLNFENSFPKEDKQFKSVDTSEIKLLVCGKETKAFKVTKTTNNNSTLHEILFYVTINNQSVIGHLSTENDVKTNNDIHPVIRQIIQLK